MTTYLLIIHIALDLVTALGWITFSKRREAFFVGILHGVFGNSLGLALAGMTQPAPVAEQPPNTTSFLLLYAIWSVVVIVASAALMAWRSKREHSESAQPPSSGWIIGIQTLIYGLVGALTGAIFFISHWVATTFAGVQADQLLFFILGGNPGTTPEQTADLTLRVILPIIGLTFAFALVPLLMALTPSRPGSDHCAAIPDRKEATSMAPSRWWRGRRLAHVGVAVTLVSALVYSFAALPLIGVGRSYFVRSQFIKDNYVEPSDQVLHFPAKPKNLIHIYLESMENSYYSKDEGGYLDKSLMPDLAKLTDENVSFSNTTHYGGPHQTYGANHSLAGMMNFQAGVPMIPFYNSSVGGRISYPNFATIGDLLHKRGYETSFMLGTFSTWHKMGQYYREHGDFKIFDLQTARQRKLVPPNYFVYWGLEDDKLYEYAKDEMTRLGNGKKPFYFILENADTHPNGGYVSTRMKEFPSDQQYGNVIHYSQGEVVKLVRWIQAQPWYKDTVIVLTGDHKSMDNQFFVGWDPHYERTVVNVFINSALPDPGPGRTRNRQYAPFDFFPTIMASLGVKVEGDRLGLGTNLYSDQPTLLERYGFDHVNEELQKRSDFYEEHRVGDIYREDIR